MKKDEEICELLKIQSHVVLLGAGASIAVMKAMQTIPTYDKTSRLLVTPPPAMNDFLKVAGLDYILKDINIHTSSNNLEDIYTELSLRSQNEPKIKEVCSILENEIRDYIGRFYYPRNQLSLYDLLILTLRRKDCIYTFNWDPLIYDARARVAYEMGRWLNKDATDYLPNIMYLHGNAKLGYCLKDKQIGQIQGYCSKCQQELKPMPLLYPTKKKHYSDGEYIEDAWKRLEHYNSLSPLLTVWGYSSPDSDNEAQEKIFQSWCCQERIDGCLHVNNKIKHLEVINTDRTTQFRNKWEKYTNPAIPPSFYDNISESVLFKFPRSTIEKYVIPNVRGKLDLGLYSNILSSIKTWEDAKNFFLPMLNSENISN